jgi:hypothetical protein
MSLPLVLLRYYSLVLFDVSAFLSIIVNIFADTVCVYVASQTFIISVEAIWIDL